MVKDGTTGKGFPVVWALHDKENAAVYQLIYDKVAEAANKRAKALQKPEFRPSVLLIDNSDKEIRGFLQSTWKTTGATYALCFFHVMRAWVENLRKYCPKDTAARVEMKEALVDIYSAKVSSPHASRLSVC